MKHKVEKKCLKLLKVKFLFDFISMRFVINRLTNIDKQSLEHSLKEHQQVIVLSRSVWS